MSSSLPTWVKEWRKHQHVHPESDTLKIYEALSVALEALELCATATSLPPSTMTQEEFHSSQFYKSIGTCARALRRIRELGSIEEMGREDARK